MRKRVRCRAIIFKDDKIVSMYREREDRIFYTFPGGGMEENESEVDCVKREVFEEFGISIEPIKKVYIYENEISLEHFYIAKYISGEFGTGTGEEFQDTKNNGVYIPKLIDIKDIPNLPLMPSEVATQFYNDYQANGKEIRNEILYIGGKLK
jgi:8-oxo-dGTP pyrophosphatase MutT (NUDIX family)